MTRTGDERLAHQCCMGFHRQVMQKGEFFRDKDRYLYEPSEDAFFYWDHGTRKIRMKFAGEDYDIEIPHDHRIFNDAILSGREVTRDEYERGTALD